MTVVNRLDASDAGAVEDSYRANPVTGMWAAVGDSRTVSETVSQGRTVKAQIVTRDGFMPYAEWAEEGAKPGTFTMRTGDWVVRGDIDLGDTTADALAALRAKGPDAMQVSSFRDLRDDSVSIGGKLGDIIQCLHCEGA